MSLNLDTIHNEATIIRLAAVQGHSNEAIATLLDTTEAPIKNRRQRIRRRLTALAEKNCASPIWSRGG